MSRIVSLISKASNKSLLSYNMFGTNMKTSINMFNVFQRNFAGRGNRQTFNDAEDELDNENFGQFGDGDDDNSNAQRGRGRGRERNEFGEGRMQRNNNRSFGNRDRGDNNFQRSGYRDRNMGFRRRNQEALENAEVSKNRMMITNLAFSATTDDLRQLVEQFGTIVDIQLPTNAGNRQLNRGFGFVTFENEEDCANAINKLNMSDFDNRQIKAFYAKNLRPSNVNED